MTAFDKYTPVEIMDPDDSKLMAAIEKLKKFDPEIVKHLEDLANLAEKNKPLFLLGLNFLKRK